MHLERLEQDGSSFPRTRDGGRGVPFFHGVLFLLFLVQLLAFFGIQGEDCFITFRYARNLAEGRGLVYNPGEYVEGISNPYWALCLAGLYRLGLSMTFACSLLVFVHAAAAYAVMVAASLTWFGRHSWLSLLPPLLCCAMTILPAGYQNGLEGSAVALGMALVCLGVAGNRPAALVAGVAVLLGNRPEAPAYAAVAALWLGVGSLRAEGRARRTGLLWAGGIVALVAGMVLLRYGYYGDVVPNTMRAKGSIPLAGVFSGGMRYLGAYAWTIGPWMILLAALAPADRARRAGAVLLLLLLLINAAVVLRNGGDWMVHYRLLTPFFGAFSLLSAAGFAWCWRVGNPIFRVALSVLLLAGLARLPDRVVLADSLLHWEWRLDVVMLPLDGGNYHVDNHVTGPVMGQEADDLLIAENGGRLPHLLKEVRVLEMAGLTDRDLVSESSPCRDRVAAIGVLNWHGMFVGKKPTYVQFPPPDIRARLSRLLECPEVAPSLDLFIIAQNPSRLKDTGHLDLLMVRNDRLSLAHFIRDFGAFVPAANMAPGFQQGEGMDPESWRDITVGPWALEAWRDTRTGEPLSESWRDWFGRERHSAEMPLGPGTSRFSKPLADGCPLLVAVDLLPGAPDDTRLTFRRTGDGESWTVSPAGGGFPADKYRCHYLFIPESAPGTSGELLLDAETSSDCQVRVSVSRWASGPPPALPEPHLYPDKSDCRGMIARRTHLDVAVERMTSLYLEENDLDGLLGEWDAMDPAFLSADFRHCARGRAFEESGRPADALREYAQVADRVSIPLWNRVPEALRKWLRRIPAWAHNFPDKFHLTMALGGTARSLADLGNIAGAETAQFAAIRVVGDVYAVYEALEVLYTAHLSPGEAEPKWRAVVGAHPDHAWARYFFSLACSRVSRHEDALREARAALALGPDIAGLQARVGGMVQNLAADHFSQGRFAECLPLWREVGGAVGKLGEAKALAAMGDVAGAETELLAAVRATGDDYAVFEALDGLYADHLPPGEAEQKWRAVAAAHPGNAWARYFLSLACSRVSRHDEAVCEARAALALGPDNQMLQAHVMATVQKLAADHLSQGRFSECLSLWREVGGVAGKLGAAKALAALGDVAGAETELLAAVRATGDNYAVFEALDDLYTAHHSPGEAVQKWRAVVAVHPDHAWPRYLLSRACARTSHHEDALLEARAALALSPDNQVMQAHVLATVRKVAAEHLSQGRFAECLSLWREVGCADGKLGEAKALAALGNAQGAEEAYLSLLLAGPGPQVFDAYEGLYALYAAAWPPGEHPAKWSDVVRQVPGQPWAHIYRGCALDALSRGDEAQEAYVQAAAALMESHMRGD